MSSKPKKKSLSIRLSESAVYLRTDRASRRSRNAGDVGSSVLRGLLVLELAKPTKISSIELELTATTQNAWPEGVGARRLEINEEHKAFHASTVYFSASKSLPSTRRTASLGPGVTFTAYEHDRDWDLVVDDDEEEPIFGGPTQDSIPSSPIPPAAAPPRSRSLVVSNPSFDSRLAGPSLVPLASRNRRVSVDSQFFQRDHVSYQEHSNDPPIPPYSPIDPSSPIFAPVTAHDLPSVQFLPIQPDRSPSVTYPDPAGELEEFRATLNSRLGNISSRNGSVVSVPSMHDRSLSRVTSRTMEGVPEDEDNEDSPEAPTYAPILTDGSGHTPVSGSASGDSLPQSNLATSNDPRSSALMEPPQPRMISTSRSRESRRHSRFSLSSMADALKEVVRSTSRGPRSAFPPLDLGDSALTARNRSRDVSVDGRSPSLGPRGRTLDRRPLPTDQVPSNPGSRVASPVPLDEPRLPRVFGSGSHHHHEAKDKHKERGLGLNHGWKEFKRGTYTYPISFTIPSTAPPTMQTTYGSVVWRLNATVHRPGALKQKMSISREVLVLTCPTEEDTEDTDNVIVERPWDDQLQYLVSISGRCFYIGGTVPITIALMPLAKIKVYRFSVYIEERVDYYTEMRRIIKSDPVSRYDLMSVKEEGGKDAPHILPLESDDREALKLSPLYSIIEPGADESEVISMLMGPGPWTFHQNLQLPNSCERMHFTNKNKRANIVITHTLKVVIRVERGDDLFVDKRGKRKMFDIVIQTPVQILSCRCNPDWVSLPRYSETFNDDAPIVPNCPCQIRRMQEPHSHVSFLDRMHLRPSDHSTPHPHESASNTHDQQPSRSDGPSTAPSAPSSPNPIEHPLLARAGSNDVSTFQTSQQFERLVAGFESEYGEPPPAYTSVPVRG